MPAPIDVDALHRLVYRRSDRHHRYKMNAQALAEELGLSYFNFTRIIGRMAEAGRLRQISGTKFGSKVYVVEDPHTWERQPA